MDKFINVAFGKRAIEEYQIVVQNRTECTLYAASELANYVFKATGKPLATVFEKTDRPAIFINCATEFNDGFKIYFDGEDLCLVGKNERSALYAVYELLERIGWRFFADEMAFRGMEAGVYTYPCEKFLSKTDVFMPLDFCVEQNAKIAYRDGWSFANKNPAFCAKLRINAGTWETRNMESKFGGGRRFAGREGHTFSKLLPITEFGNSHPEFFAEIDGKRASIGDKAWQESLYWANIPQFCLTNYASVPFVVEKVKDWKEKEPWGEYVSVSQNDNQLFCQCEKCKKSYEKYGKFGTLILYVNEVAKEVEKIYPDLKIQTYSYWGTDDVTACVKAHKNVVVQWCPVKVCRNHSLNDESCPLNKLHYDRLKTLSQVTENIFIFDYRSCLKYAMLLFTDLFTLRETMKTYADLNVTGLYSEMCLETLNEPTFEELKVYLFGKLAWNPYMSDEEFNRHINEFLEGYYGEGWGYVREFLEKWCSINPKLHYTSFYGSIATDDLKPIFYDDGRAVEGRFVPQEKLQEFIEYANGLFDKAVLKATKEQKPRIEIARTSLLWYELFHTMDEIMAGDDDELKEKTKKKVFSLCERMRLYQMKYTNGIGMKNITYMYDDFSIPVSKWNYTGGIAGAFTLN